jgi:hypothetical protein
VKHSRYLVARFAEAREALAMIHTLADDFTAEVQTLARMTVTDRQWEQFVDAHIPVRRCTCGAGDLPSRVIGRQSC